MEIYVNTQELQAAVATVIKAASPKGAMPILEGIYFRASDNEITLRCSDMSLEIETSIPADVRESGEIVIQLGKTFFDFIRRVPGDLIALKLTDKILNIKSGRIDTNLSCMSAADFPDMPPVDGEVSLSIEQNILREMISQTIFAVSTDESRPILTGVLMEINDGKLNTVAIDGYRLAWRKENISNDIKEQGVVVPSKSFLEISRALIDSDDLVNMKFSKTHAEFNVGHTKLTTRLLDGQFINYKQILPDKQSTRVRIDRKELLSSIERAVIVTREANSATVRLAFSKGELTITARGEGGNFIEVIQPDIKGDDLTISFNARYMTEALNTLDEEEIYLEMTNATSPCVIKPVNGDAFYFLVLPVRTI